MENIKAALLILTLVLFYLLSAYLLVFVWAVL